jgi:hypothetical protein
MKRKRISKKDIEFKLIRLLFRKKINEKIGEIHILYFSKFLTIFMIKKCKDSTKFKETRLN